MKGGATKVTVRAEVPRNWLREAISDGDGLADMAYIVIGALSVAAIATLAFICFMSAFDYNHCLSTPQTVVAKGEASVTSIVPCRYDPLPTGQSAGLIFGAYAALIGGLAAYMVATRRGSGRKPPP